MQMQTKDAGRLAELAARMAQASAKASEARADEAVAALRDEYDREPRFSVKTLASTSSKAARL